MSRTAYYYVNKTSDDSELKSKILALANQYPQHGYWKIYYLLRDEGYIVNHKRVYRVYKELGLTIKNRKRLCELSQESFDTTDPINASLSENEKIA